MEDTDANMFLIYLMDRFVWMLLITVFTTAVLQQCGVVATNEFHETSTPLQENFQFEMEPDNKIFDYAVRQKRQQSPSVSSPVIDGLFNIPIATLSAVNNFIQTTRPGIQQIIQNYQMANQQQPPRGLQFNTNGQHTRRGTNNQSGTSRLSRGGRFFDI
ncbi:uncharacterized protein LOC123293679 isoform X2 [Chrysoperla carnea]|uniref:uncharacterized protein LOC123293679 isoform X2 n=1 Tax=Chrysoperla carnea TaxID=189513 RepID=UPI001D0683D0|nr:uncharacterized protein LOC123293679 isoform X2 [Chrysoperla carnea]